MFISGDIHLLIERSMNEIMQLIHQQTLDVTVSRTDSRIARSIEWLLSNQNENGSWGHNNVAITSLVMIAFSNLLQPAGIWQLDDIVVNSLEKGEDFLQNKYSDNQFENAVWDTAVAIRALKKIGKKSHNLISDRISWMLSMPPDSINAGPHHFAQKALCLAECGVQSHEIEDAAKQAVKRLKNGGFRYSPYVTSQCLEAIQIAQLRENDDTKKIEESLVLFLESTHLDSANFINICTSLNALAPIKNTKVETRIRLSVASLFGETCFRDDGTWYHDEMQTAWALIALTRYSKEVVIRAPKSEITYEFKMIISDLIERAVEYSKNCFRWWCTVLAVSFLGGGILSFFITYTSLKEDMTEWMKWLIGSSLSLIFGFIFQYIIRYFKKIKPTIDEF